MTPLLQLLVAEGALTESGHLLVTRFMDRWNCTAFEALLEVHYFSEDELADTIARILKMDRMYHLDGNLIQSEILDILSFRKARTHVCLPYAFLDDNHLEIVVADPTSMALREQLEQEYSITWIISDRTSIIRTIDEIYPFEAQLKKS